jgi:hypothetical protein
VGVGGGGVGQGPRMPLDGGMGVAADSSMSSSGASSH